MLDVRRLLLLRDLDRLGTIAAVAAAHTYTPSAVSQQLSVLEREAGVALLERSGRRVTLTAAGRVLVRHAADVLAALEQADAALAAVRGEPAGPLRIGAYPSAVRTVLPGALVALGRDFPALELSVTEIDPVTVPVAVRERRVDAGLMHDYSVAPAVADGDLSSVPLFEEKVYLAVPASLGAAPVPESVISEPAVPEAAVAEAAVSGLRDLPWVLASPGTLCHEVTLRVCRSAGFVPRARHHADDFGAVLALVAAGQGVSLVPELAVDRLPDGVRLIDSPTRRRTRVAFRRGSADHPAVAALIAALRTAASDFMGRRHGYRHMDLLAVE